MIGCDRFVDRVQVTRKNFGYNENGLQYLITFRGYDHDPGQFSIELDESNTFENREKLVILSQTVSPYNHASVFYEPIPFEFLRTYEHKP